MPLFRKGKNMVTPAPGRTTNGIEINPYRESAKPMTEPPTPADLVYESLENFKYWTIYNGELRRNGFVIKWDNSHSCNEYRYVVLIYCGLEVERCLSEIGKYSSRINSIRVACDAIVRHVAEHLDSPK